MERHLITNGTVLTMEPGDRPRRSDVLIENDVIVAVGPNLSADANVLDATDCIVAPGFVDTHRHTWQTAVRGLVSNDVLKDYFRSVRFQGSLVYRPEDMAIGTLAGMLEAIDAGVTTVMDFNNNISSAESAEACVSAIRESGIRGRFGLGMNGTFGQNDELSTLDGRVALVRRLRESDLSSDTALVTLAMALSDLPEVGVDRVAAELAVARELGIRSTTNSLAILFHDPVNDIAEFDSRGLIGPDLLWVHNIYATDEQLRRVTDLGTHTAVCPEAELALGMGRPATTRLLAAGGHCSFGCDTVSSTSGDLIQQARLALQVARLLDNDDEMQKGHAPEPFDLHVETLVRALTIWGAEALGIDDRVGSLRAGKQADIVVVRADAPNTAPLNDPYSTLLTQAHPGNVDTVLVAGALRKQHGRLTSDWAAVRTRLQQSRDYISEAIETVGGWHPEPGIPLPW
jgi:cytosine/adenosine deaminase-related metal-dependent hydrolase